MLVTLICDASAEEPVFTGDTGTVGAYSSTYVSIVGHFMTFRTHFNQNQGLLEYQTEGNCQWKSKVKINVLPGRPLLI